MQKIVPFLWFDGQAEEAAKFYISIFKTPRCFARRRCPSRSSSEGQEFYALMASAVQFTPAISLS